LVWSDFDGALAELKSPPARTKYILVDKFRAILIRFEIHI
jgi:hypothetical protein